MKVFIDTGFFIAFFIDKEQHHPDVLRKYKEYRTKRAVFLTSDYVLDEFYTRLIYDYGIAITKKIVNEIEMTVADGDLGILNVNEPLFRQSLKVFLKFSEHKISFTDASTYVLFKEFQLDEIFTLDDDFKKIGLPTS